MLPRIITLEEHFDSQAFAASDELHGALPKHLHDRLRDLDNGRIADMDAGNTSVQIISHIGGPTPVDGCIRANDVLAAACARHPQRFAGWAALPMQDPQAAVVELRRAVNELGFVGALINNHTEDGSMYDDSRFWPVFEESEKLDIPIYIHPTYPVDNMSSHYRGNFDKFAEVMMAASGWGWHSECGLHILRLYASGLFDKFPRLKIVIGHMGEMIPYMFDRIARTSERWGNHTRDLRTVWRENIWVTTSGLFTLPPFECLLKISPMEKIMLSIDYPFSTTDMGKQFVEDIQSAGILSSEQLDAFCHGNAERLLKLKQAST